MTKLFLFIKYFLFFLALQLQLFNFFSSSLHSSSTSNFNISSPFAFSFEFAFADLFCKLEITNLFQFIKFFLVFFRFSVSPDIKNIVPCPCRLLLHLRIKPATALNCPLVPLPGLIFSRPTTYSSYDSPDIQTTIN